MIEVPRNLADAGVYEGGVLVRQASGLDFAIVTEKSVHR